MSHARNSARATRSSRFGAAIVLLAAALFVAHSYALRFTQDDAYISLQYARNLAEGHGLVFNIGERVEGYSNFAWTMWLALLVRVGLPAMDIARCMGVACMVAAILLAARFARSIEGRWGVAAAGAAILAAASSPLALWGTSGMETGFHTLIVTAALVTAFARDPSRRTHRNATLLFLLAAFSRPDAPVLFAGWMASRTVDVFRRRAAAEDSVRALVQDAALFVAPLVPYVAAKMLYYGEIVPNTYYAKSGLAALYVVRGLDEAKNLALRYGAALVAPALAVLATRHRTDGPRLLRLLAVIALYAVYIVFVGGDVLPYFRFWLPILPMSCALIALGACVAAEWLPRGVRLRGPAATSVIVGIAASGFLMNWDGIRAQRYAMNSVLGELLGRWVAQHLGPNDAVAATPIGAVAYFSRRPVIDMLGLVDREIARHPEPLEGVTDTWKEKKYNAASVLRRRPAVIFFSTGVRPSAAGEQALFLYEDFHRNYFAQYIRPDSTVSQPATIYRLRPDAQNPPDSLVPTEKREFLQHWCHGLIATLREGDHRAAVGHFDLAVETAPPFFRSAKEWQASTRYIAGDMGSVPQLREVLAADRYALLASYCLGHYLLVENQLEECEELLLAHVAINPDEARVWHFLSEISARRGRYAEAIERLDRSLALSSVNPPGVTMRAQLVAALGQG